MRLQQNPASVIWADFLSTIGKGHPVEIQTDVVLPPQVQCPENTTASLISQVYPGIAEKIPNIRATNSWLKERAFLSPLNDGVAILNSEVLTLFPGQTRTYRSADKLVYKEGVDGEHNQPAAIQQQPDRPHPLLGPEEDGLPVGEPLPGDNLDPEEPADPEDEDEDEENDEPAVPNGDGQPPPQPAPPPPPQPQPALPPQPQPAPPQADGRRFDPFQSNQAIENLHVLNSSSLPLHGLKLKVGAIIMCLRNLAPSTGLCNGTRLIVTHLAERVIEGQILGGRFDGGRVFIPRVSLDVPADEFTFNWQRRQVPCVSGICYDD